MEKEMKRAKVIDNAKDYVRIMFKDNSGGHDVGHTMRVYANAMAIAEAEGIQDTFAIALAALLHDVDDYKLFKTTDNANARAFMKGNRIPDNVADEICTMINEDSFSKNKDRHPSSIQAMIVQDADRLDALGAIGIARTFSFGGEHGRSLENNIAHFHEKLLLLKDLMNTGTAKAIAQDRHNYMEDFLRHLEDEKGSNFRENGK